MQEGNGDMESTQVLEERNNFGNSPDASVDDKMASAKSEEARKTEGTRPEDQASVSGAGTIDIELPRSGKADSTGGRVTEGITVIELEMMPKMEDMGRLEEIIVGGTTNIDPEVIGSIAGIAVQSVEGVSSLGTPSLRRTIRERLGSAERTARGIEVEVGRREVVLDINIRVVFGYNIPRTVIAVRQTVAEHLLNLCGLIAKEINIKVIGIEFPDKTPGRVQ